MEKSKTPAGIIIWLVITIITAISILSAMRDYYAYPAGAIILTALTALIVACIILTLTRVGRLIIGISHLAIASISIIYQTILFITIGICANTQNGCGSAGVAVFIPFLLFWPTTYFLGYGLYFTLSKKVKAYFAK
jgi:hypothetical protein